MGARMTPVSVAIDTPDPHLNHLPEGEEDVTAQVRVSSA
jgi:hypothetical protein